MEHSTLHLYLSAVFELEHNSSISRVVIMSGGTTIAIDEITDIAGDVFGSYIDLI